MKPEILAYRALTKEINRCLDCANIFVVQNLINSIYDDVAEQYNVTIESIKEIGDIALDRTIRKSLESKHNKPPIELKQARRLQEAGSVWNFDQKAFVQYDKLNTNNALLDEFIAEHKELYCKVQEFKQRWHVIYNDK